MAASAWRGGGRQGDFARAGSSPQQCAWSGSDTQFGSSLAKRMMQCVCVCARAFPGRLTHGDCSPCQTNTQFCINPKIGQMRGLRFSCGNTSGTQAMPLAIPTGWHASNALHLTHYLLGWPPPSQEAELHCVHSCVIPPLTLTVRSLHTFQVHLCMNPPPHSCCMLSAYLTNPFTRESSPSQSLCAPCIPFKSHYETAPDSPAAAAGPTMAYLQQLHG